MNLIKNITVHRILEKYLYILIKNSREGHT